MRKKFSKNTRPLPINTKPTTAMRKRYLYRNPKGLLRTGPLIQPYWNDANLQPVLREQRIAPEPKSLVRYYTFFVV